MSTTAIRAVFHQGMIEPLEKIPYEDTREAIILFLDKVEPTK